MLRFSDKRKNVCCYTSTLSPHLKGTAHENHRCARLRPVCRQCLCSTPACEAKAVSKDGKPLAGAAKNSSIKKCMGDIKAACETKAVSESGKKLGGAAKNSIMKKCESDAG